MIEKLNDPRLPAAVGFTVSGLGAAVAFMFTYQFKTLLADGLVTNGNVLAGMVVSLLDYLQELVQSWLGDMILGTGNGWIVVELLAIAVASGVAYRVFRPLSALTLMLAERAFEKPTPLEW